MNTQTHTMTLGGTSVSVLQHQVGEPAAIKLIRVHGDELVARECGLAWLQACGGEFIDIDNPWREVRFEINNVQHSVDPNRIFSPEGIAATLVEQGSLVNPHLLNEVSKLAHTITQLLASAETVVALHNNQDFNITYYQPGGECFGAGTLVHHSIHMHPHDFILVNQRSDYQALVDMKMNVVWLNDEVIDHPGSLSEYCCRAQQRYFNIEAMQGHLSAQNEMLQAVMKVCSPLFS